MGKSTPYFALLASYFCVLVVCTSAQEFLSIDCGSAVGYPDPLGFDWVTDDKFIQSGKNLKLSSVNHPRQTLRYFPEGMSKNCYVLPVQAATTYLLRVRMYPGSITEPGDKEMELPFNFNVTVNNNLLWAYSVTADSERESYVKEAIFHTFDSKEVYLCLIKGTKGVPFINSIEMREQHSTSYYNQAEKGGQFMVMGDRVNTGPAAESSDILRYPDDQFDRFWWAGVPPKYPNFTTVETTLPSDSFDSTADPAFNWPPNKILQDAWIGPDLSMKGKKRAGMKRIYTLLYFKEIRTTVNLTDLEANPVGMTIGVNTNLRSVSLTDNSTQQYGFINEIGDGDSFDIIVQAQNSSIHDGILNGFEYYSTYNINSSATYTADKNTLQILQKSFDLQAWTGDPCFPVEWNWLMCDPKSSKIKTLKLSNMNISGTIPKEIGSLPELVEIYLDNNNLSGSIPTSLAKLKKLQVLALDNNNLSGTIPSAFQNKAGFSMEASLDASHNALCNVAGCRFSGNPGLCVEGKSCNSTTIGNSAVAVKGSSTFYVKHFAVVLIVFFISIW